MLPEYLDDFSADENKMFADIICNGFTHEEIEDLLAMAGAVWGEEA